MKIKDLVVGTLFLFVFSMGVLVQAATPDSGEEVVMEFDGQEYELALSYFSNAPTPYWYNRWIVPVSELPRDVMAMEITINYELKEQDVDYVRNWFRLDWRTEIDLGAQCQEPFGTKGDVIFACLNPKATGNKDGLDVSQTFDIYRITTKGYIRFEFQARPEVMQKMAKDRKLDHWITEMTGWYPPYPIMREYKSMRTNYN